jgi:NADH:ubiquinone oxidoreductase subunit D
LLQAIKDGKIGRSMTTFDAKMPYRFPIGIYGTEGALRNNELFAPKLLPGHMISDVVAILGSFDFVMGECDR